MCLKGLVHIPHKKPKGEWLLGVLLELLGISTFPPTLSSGGLLLNLPRCLLYLPPQQSYMKLIHFLAGCGSLTGIKSVISERLSRMSQCSAHSPPCDFTVLALLWGILQCLAQEGTPVEDSNHGCHLSLVGYIVHNKNALHSDSQSKGH